jgi:hypothetical protein
MVELAIAIVSICDRPVIHDVCFSLRYALLDLWEIRELDSSTNSPSSSSFILPIPASLANNHRNIISHQQRV